MVDRACKDCVWYQVVLVDKPGEQQGFGTCRFNPPTLTPSAFPQVNNVDWCSQFRELERG